MHLSLNACDVASGEREAAGQNAPVGVGISIAVCLMVCLVGVLYSRLNHLVLRCRTVIATELPLICQLGFR